MMLGKNFSEVVAGTQNKLVVVWDYDL